MDTYQIIITGDNNLEGWVQLTDDEIATFMKVVNKLEPDGRWAPKVIVTNLTEAKREQERLIEEQRQKEKTEETKFIEACSHMGKYSIRDKYPDLMSMFSA